MVKMPMITKSRPNIRANQ